MAKQMKSLDEAMNFAELLDSYDVALEDSSWYTTSRTATKDADGNPLETPQEFRVFNVFIGTDEDGGNLYASFALSRKFQEKHPDAVLDDNFIESNIKELRFLEAEDANKIGSIFLAGEDPRKSSADLLALFNA